MLYILIYDITLRCVTLHYIPVHSITLNYTTLHQITRVLVYILYIIILCLYVSHSYGTVAFNSYIFATFWNCRTVTPRSPAQNNPIRSSQRWRRRRSANTSPPRIDGELELDPQWRIMIMVL